MTADHPQAAVTAAPGTDELGVHSLDIATVDTQIAETRRVSPGRHLSHGSAASHLWVIGGELDRDEELGDV